jgi:NADH dehydrogenase
MNAGRSPGTIAVTGATGMLGSSLCARFLSRGWHVRALGRRPPSAALADAAWFRCALPDDIDPAALRGADVVVHCAYATRSVNRLEDEKVNVEGTRRLLGLAREAGVRRVVFVSSATARPDAPSFYGRSKFALERELDPERDLAVRPGLILAPSAGLFQRLLAFIRRTRLVPLFGGGRQIVQTVHADDLCLGFERALERDLRGVLTIAEPEGLPSRDFMRLLALHTSRRCLLVPVPLAPTLALLRAFEKVGIVLPVS